MSVEQGEDGEPGEEPTAEDADVKAASDDAEAASVDAEVPELAESRCGISLGSDDD